MDNVAVTHYSLPRILYDRQSYCPYITWIPASALLTWQYDSHYTLDNIQKSAMYIAVPYKSLWYSGYGPWQVNCVYDSILLAKMCCFRGWVLIYQITMCWCFFRRTNYTIIILIERQCTLYVRCTLDVILVCLKIYILCFVHKHVFNLKNRIEF